jgi:hypothetical protein
LTAGDGIIAGIAGNEGKDFIVKDRGFVDDDFLNDVLIGDLLAGIVKIIGKIVEQELDELHDDTVKCSFLYLWYHY